MPGGYTNNFPKNWMIFCRVGECAMTLSRVLPCWVDQSINDNNSQMAKFWLVVKLWLKNCLGGHGGGVWNIFGPLQITNLNRSSERMVTK